MSDLWSVYVIAIVAINILGCVFLLLWTRKINPADMAEDGTTGHEYDGIKEYNKPLPAWWLKMFWLTIAFAIGYLIYYPGLGNFKGVGGWTSHGEHDADQKAYEAKFGKMYADFAAQPIEQLAKDEKAMKIAERLFANNCAICHGADAQGAKGFPNLTDDDWLWGGAPEQIKTTILNGRGKEGETTRMPAWQATLGEQGVKEVAAYALSLSGRVVDPALRDAGQGKFAACAGCHGADGKGNQALGAPNLTDTVWLFGGSNASVEKTIAEGRGGVMPAWKDILGEAKVHLLAAYVYSKSHHQ